VKKSEKYSIGARNKYTLEKKLTVLQFPQKKKQKYCKLLFIYPMGQVGPVAQSV